MYITIFIDIRLLPIYIYIYVFVYMKVSCIYKVVLY